LTHVACIVEGHGEVAALPVLLRRLALWRTPDCHLELSPPLRVHRDRFLKRDEEFSRHLLMASRKCGAGGWVLVLLDADDDCPAELGASILKRARQVLPHRPVSIVLAKREFEAWFIGAAGSLDGHRGLSIAKADLAIDPELPRNAKGWLRLRMKGGTYGETTDQPAFSAKMDLEQAEQRCRSFRKLCSEWDTQFARNKGN
jgi:hypothetical protein